MPDRTQAEELGEWIASQRNSLGITVREAARRAEISEGQWGRIEKGESGTKRNTLGAMLAALRISPSSDEYAEGFRKAGYSPSIDSEWELPSARMVYEQVDVPALIAFLEGLPPSLQREEYERIRQLWLDHRRGQTDYGKLSDE